MGALRLSTREYVYLALMVACFVLLLVLPLLTSGYLLTLLTDILKFVILTVAWVIFSGPTGYISLATAAFYGLGFYTAAIFSESIPFVLVIPMAGAISFVVALGVGALTLRLRGVYFAIFTFGLVELTRNVVLEVERVISHTRGRFVQTESTEVVYVAIVIVLILTIITAIVIRRSRYGLALTGIGEYEEAAAHIGVNVTRTKVLTFATSAIFMGMAGAIIANKRAYIDPGIAFDLNHSFLPVLMAIFGGMQNLIGPVIGAVIFTYLGEFLLTRLPDLYMLIFGLVLILAILFLPNGVLGLLQKGWSKIRGRPRAPA
jgi:branched-chain amino acid transport system permease protein